MVRNMSKVRNVPPIWVGFGAQNYPSKVPFSADFPQIWVGFPEIDTKHVFMKNPLIFSPNFSFVKRLFKKQHFNRFKSSDGTLSVKVFSYSICLFLKWC